MVLPSLIAAGDVVLGRGVVLLGVEDDGVEGAVEGHQAGNDP